MNTRNFTKEGLDAFKEYFNPEKADCLLRNIRKSTRDKAKIIAKPGELIVNVLGHLLSALRNPGLLPEKKISVIAAIGYIVFPLDFIPDSISVIGFTDDIAMVSWVVWQIKEYSTFSLEKLDEEINQNLKNCAEIC